MCSSTEQLSDSPDMKYADRVTVPGRCKLMSTRTCSVPVLPLPFLRATGREKKIRKRAQGSALRSLRDKTRPGETNAPPLTHTRELEVWTSNT